MESKPLHYLQWHITHLCNLRCVHCYQNDYNAHMDQQLMFSALDKYCDFLEERNLQGQINLTGGEPLLHPCFFSLAEEITKRGIRLGILTNGTLIDQQMADKLAKLKPIFVQISLDGTQKYHDSIRGEGNYAKAIKAIDCLKKANVKVLVSFTAQKSNCDCFIPLSFVCRRHKVDKLWFDRVVTDNEESKQKLAVTTEQFARLVKQAKFLNKLFKRKDGTSTVSVSRSLQNLDGVGYQCSAGKNLLIMLADGNLMACRRLPFIIGNISDGSISQIVDNSETMNKLAKFYLPKGCERCKHLIRCKGGSRCVTYGQTGDLYCRDVNCFYNDFD